MAATYPSPNEKATLRHSPDGIRDPENPSSHHDGADSGSQGSMRTGSSPTPAVTWEIGASQLSSSWKRRLQVFGNYLLILVLLVGIAAIVAALGVLTAPVSAVLLVVFLITYSFIRPAQILGHKKLDNITWLMMVGFTGVALLLFVGLVILFSIFRLVPSLESEEIADMEVWKWLEIALVSCLFGIIWIGGSFLWNYVQYEYDYKEDLIYFVTASRWAVNCICFFGGEHLVLKVAPGYKSKVVIYGLPIWKWIAVTDLIICACHVVRIVTRSIILYLDSHYEGGKKKNNRRYVVYMARGLEGSINVVLFMVLTLLTWAFYVDDSLDLKSSTDHAKRFLHYAKGTFLAIVLGSVLWMLKKFLLLIWEARQVYKRLTDRIPKAWKQLYFLIMIFRLEEADLVNWSIYGTAAGQGSVPEEEKTTAGDEHDGAKSSAEDKKAPSPLGDSKRGGDRGDAGGQTTKKGSDGSAAVGNQPDGGGDARSTAEKKQDVAYSVDDDSIQGGGGVGGDEPTTVKNHAPNEPAVASNTKKQDRKKRKTDNAKDIIQKILDRVKKETITYDALQRMSVYIVAAEELWISKEEEGSTDSLSSKMSKFGAKWKKEYPRGKDREVTKDELGKKLNKMIKEEDNLSDQVYEDKLTDEDLKVLYEQLQEIDRTREQVWYGDLEKWLTRAHKNCQTLGRALAGNIEGAVYLNKILTVAVSIVVSIVWLFLVKLATIEIIAAIASPLIALAFVFGDSTAKILFQGLIFAFCVRPFDVGDICVINNTQGQKVIPSPPPGPPPAGPPAITETLEVKRLGIWKTVFLREGCNDEEVIYPNSALANMTIFKHINVIDLSDYLEFYASKITTTKQREEMKRLRKNIKQYLEERDEKFEKKCSQIVVKDIGDKVKIGVRFKHLMSCQDMSYLECLKKKNKSTSELLEHIMLLVEEYEKKVSATETENGVLYVEGEDEDRISDAT